MKIKEEYKIRKIAGESIIINQGGAGADLTKIISLNSTAEFLFESFVGKEFSVEDVAEALLCNYGIDKELAAADAEKWVKQMVKTGIVG